MLLAAVLLSGCAPAMGQVLLRGGNHYETPRPYYGPRCYRPRPRVVMVPQPLVVIYPSSYYAAPPRAYYPGRPYSRGGHRGWRRY